MISFPDDNKTLVVDYDQVIKALKTAHPLPTIIQYQLYKPKSPPNIFYTQQTSEGVQHIHEGVAVQEDVCPSRGVLHEENQEKIIQDEKMMTPMSKELGSRVFHRSGSNSCQNIQERDSENFGKKVDPSQESDAISSSIDIDKSMNPQHVRQVIFSGHQSDSNYQLNYVQEKFQQTPKLDVIINIFRSIIQLIFKDNYLRKELKKLTKRANLSNEQLMELMRNFSKQNQKFCSRQEENHVNEEYQDECVDFYEFIILFLANSQQKYKRRKEETPVSN